VRTPEFGKAEWRTADPSASLGMTILFGNAKHRFQDELSSRPERSGAEGSAVCHSAFPNSGVLTQTLQAVHHHRKQLLMRGAGLINQVVTELGVGYYDSQRGDWSIPLIWATLNLAP
jgi:hypothetical protein